MKIHMVFDTHKSHGFAEFAIELQCILGKYLACHTSGETNSVFAAAARRLRAITDVDLT